MSDLGSTPVTPPTPDTGIPVEKAPGGFFGTRNGKIVLGVVGVIVVLGIVGALAAMFMFGGLFAGISPKLAGLPATAPGANATTGSVDVAVIVNPPTLPLSSNFTFRNVFAPTVKPPQPPSEVTSRSAEASTTGSTNSPDTLYLIDIISTGGAEQAVFVWNGETYTVSAGADVGSSPWKVLEIGTDSVLMLYGDSQVTLTVGQGITK